MIDYQDTFTIRLKCIGPVFVGSGKEIDKKEYLFIDNKHVGVLDFVGFYNYLESRRLSRSFEEFVLNSRRGKLGEWLQKSGVKEADYRPYLKYILENGDTVLERGTEITIMEMTKDPYGNPFIPGSSLKGMIRTLLMCQEIVDEQESYKAFKQMIKDEISNSISRNRKGNRRLLNREEKNIQTKVFNRLNREKKPERKSDARNDIMAGLIVGDSYPLDTDDMILAQKIERSIDGTEKRLNLVRECIKPGTVIEFPMTIDKSINSNLTRERIEKAVICFSDVYNECFISKYKGFDRISDSTVYLGGGSGFVSKTVNYHLFGSEDGTRVNRDVFVGTGVPKNHKHELDVKKGVSPHIIKCTLYKGKLYQMGQCELEIVV